MSNIYDTMEMEAEFMMALLEDTDWNDESDHNCSNELLIIFEGLIVAVVVVTYVIDICVSICLSIAYKILKKSLPEQSLSKSNRQYH